MNVFIAHGPTDERAAGKIMLELLKRGVAAEIDQLDPTAVPESQEVRDATLNEQIAKSDVFVLVLSPAATTNPKLLAQLDVALANECRVISVVRPGLELMAAWEKRLVGKETIDLPRTDVTNTVNELLRLLGLDPDIITNDLISPMDVKEWLPGFWQCHFYNPITTVRGFGEFEFDAAQKTELEVRTNDFQEIWISILVQGRWSMNGDRFNIQGVGRMAMQMDEAPLPRQIPYLLSLKVVRLERGLMYGFSGAGDRVIFRRVGDEPPANRIHLQDLLDAEAVAQKEKSEAQEAESAESAPPETPEDGAKG
jgi:TIR domain